MDNIRSDPSPILASPLFNDVTLIMSSFDLVLSVDLFAADTGVKVKVASLQQPIIISFVKPTIPRGRMQPPLDPPLCVVEHGGSTIENELPPHQFCYRFRATSGNRV